jgi:hypothetical protein
VLAVEERKGRSGDPGSSKLRQTGPRAGQISIRRRVAADRHASCSPSPMPKLVNPLPQALPKECAKAANICAWLSYISLYSRNIFPVKSFVDSGNNGLDGVCIAVAPQSALI